MLVWPDDVAAPAVGRVPKFPLTERLYFLNAVRYVAHASLCAPRDVDTLPAIDDARADLGG